MGKTIVILMMLLVLNSLLRIARISRTTTKESTISYIKERLDRESNNTATQGVRSLAFVIVLAIDILIIYFSIDVIFFFLS